VLDSDTKRIIDKIRDILVGKIPNPQSQVDQITNGLIYKFMDDMDQESVELGGEKSFFTDEYEKYAWKNLFDPKLGGEEKVKLYSQGIENMYFNPNAPKIFREIFKNAYLPFKDPEILNLFLKEINTFTYSHSEKLGDAFEYLLSFTGSQSEAGQFRTPRHIIDFIVDIVNPKKDESILDPACGTAGFLITAYKHIVKNNTESKPGDKLGVEEKKTLGKNLYGYDIEPQMVKLSLVNMYLKGFTNPQIFEYDTLTHDDKWLDYFDVVIANPPFMTPKGGIKPHSRFSIQSSKAEQLFISYILDHLKPEGRAGIIVPEGILENINSAAIKKLRKQLVKDGLYGIVSLPVGVFNPYAKSIKTSILLIDKKTSSMENSVLCYKIESDGFDLGLTRKKVDSNDLPDALQVLKDFKINNYEINLFSERITLINKTDILENKDHSLNIKDYLESDINTSFNLIPLKSLFDIEGGTIQSNDCMPGTFDFITASAKWKTHNEYTHECESLIYAVGASGSLGRVHYVNGKFTASNLCLILTPNKEYIDDINMRYYFYYFNEMREQIVDQLNRGAAKKSIGQTKLKSLEIPFPDIKQQDYIVKKLEENDDIVNDYLSKIESFNQKIDTLKSNNKSILLEPFK
jgi:type I restriction enzyme M protein